MSSIGTYLVESLEGLKNYPIKFKLVIISLVVVVATLLLAAITFTLFQVSTYRSNLLQNASAMAKLVASESDEALLALDSREALSRLQDFNAIGSIDAIAIFKADGNFFVGTGNYQAIVQEEKTAKQINFNEVTETGYFHHFLDYALHVQVPIIVENKLVGSVHLQSSLRPLQKQINTFTMIMMLVVLVAVLISYFLISFLQRIIADPIMKFKKSVDEVRLNKNFDVIVPIKTRDELGELASGFNEMLHEIKLRDVRLEQYRASLEKSVHARTLDIQNAYKALESALRDITEEKVKAEQANKAKSEFLAMMSHEIRTPMNGILGMTALLASSNLTDEQRHYARTAHESGEVLLSLINHVLDYSRIEAGKMSLDSVEFDLLDLVSRVCALFSAQIQAKGLQLILETKMESALNLVVGDMDKVRQVLINLISNAIKFTDKGRIVVNVALISESLEGVEKRQKFQVTVSDTGIGIEAAKLASVFEVFTQEDSSTTRLRGGSGLGLSISKRLVEMMGGVIGVNSSKNQGSRFWFTVDLLCRTMVDTQHSLLMDNLKSTQPLLVVGETCGDLVKQFLLPAQVPAHTYRKEFDEAANLAEITAKTLPPNVLILNLEGKLECQLAFAVALRRHYKSKVLPIVLILDDFELNAMVRENLGTNCFCLAAPVHKDELYTTLQHILDPASMSAAKAKIGARPTALEMNILLVEDNKINQQVAEVMISRSGCMVTTVENGKLALEAFITGHFDLIFMDCHMPVMDGYEATIHIRNYERKNNMAATPIVALTANVYRGDREKAFKIGMTDYLSKPFKFEQIYQMLVKYQQKELMQENQGKTESRVPHKNHPILDQNILRELKELSEPGEESILKQILTMYIEDSPETMQEVLAAIQQKNEAKLAVSVHTLKGMSAGVGGARFAELCLQLEIACKTNELHKCENIGEKLTNQYQELCDALKHYLEQVP